VAEEGAFLSKTVSKSLVICDTPVSSLSQGEAGRLGGWEVAGECLAYLRATVRTQIVTTSSM
jgi:hypothetical protein